MDDITDPIWLRLIATSHVDSRHHIFEEIGIGNRPALLVSKQIVKLLGEHTKIDLHENDHLTPLIIKGTEGLIISFGKCCHPIPGDDIAGLIRQGHGLEVHMLHCKTLMKFHEQPDKFVPLYWEDNIEGDFEVDLKVNLINRRGSLAALALAISEAESNIENIRAEEHDKNHFNVDITISAQNRTHLARILRKIRKRKDVLLVTRFKPAR